ncbi:MAG: DJ-1/PfpI family protein [Oscillospiraceae bacterium]|nr:DJ-1/PfpI family protein [Oscillospiraceae bacterium]
MVYVFLADGISETEAVAAIECLRRAGLTVQAVGVTGTTVTSARGIKLLADIPLEDVPDGPHELLVLPGGYLGAKNLAASERVMALVRSAVESNAPVGAICAAPAMLAKLGLLRGRTITCYPTEAENARQGGAYVLDRPWVREGNLLTGQGPGSSFAFGIALVALLLGEEKADWLAEQMLVSWRA